MFRARRILRRRAIAGYAAKRGEGAGPEAQAPEAHDDAPAPAEEPGDQLRELTELREQGILTEEEFVAEKRKLLGS
jgi:Short C-terminal domain